MDAARIEELKGKNPGRELLSITVGDTEVIALVPTGKEVTQLRDMVASGGPQKGKSQELFVRNCIVDPQREALSALLDKKPFLVEKLGDELAQAAGSAEEVFVKKL